MREKPYAIVACRRVEEDIPAPIELSTKERCSKCGNDIWVSPSTAQAVSEGLYPDILVCVNCIIEGKKL